jgi:2-methylcitrate dehydratase
MTDTTIKSVTDFSAATTYSSIPAAVRHDCTRRLIDTLACALAAYHELPCRIARELAQRVDVPGGAYILGTTARTLPELAAYANGVMVRYLDGNDAYPGGGGHPSDMLPAILAAANLCRSDGKAFITAMTVAYETFYAFRQAACMRDHGMDHVFYTAVGSAVGAARIMSLDAARFANAISLAVTPNIALHATRRGDLSMWKGCAGANAARNGVFAALLAEKGMTGPDHPIEGSHGLRELVGHFEFPELPGGDVPFRLTEAQMKYFLAESHSHAPITAALELHKQVATEDIEAVTIYTYWFAWHEIGSERAKWRPTTRETADHSMPYIVAAVLIDGRFGDDLFSIERLQDERILQLADRISILEDPDLSRQFPGKYPCRIEIRTRSGKTLVAAVDYPRGHCRNPMTDEEVSSKFSELTRRVLPSSRIERALDWLWRFDEATDLDPLFELLAINADKEVA